MMNRPNKSPEPTAVGACRSAIAVHVASRSTLRSAATEDGRWLSFGSLGHYTHL